MLDPVDGSLNAKRGVPYFCLSLAVAEGPTMGDVVFGYVYDFGTGEEWTARRGEGAWLDGDPLGEVRPKDEIELLAFEATLTSTIAERAANVVGLAYRLRVMGSLALALCNLAAGRIDAVCSLKGARSVDIAAAQLLVREVGLAIELFEQPPFEDAPLDLEARSRVVAAGTPELCARLGRGADVVNELRIGCSGWNYAHWRDGVFYPPRLPPRRWLEHYAQHFDTVEVNATFYRLPRASAVANWLEQTPPGFVFTIKMSRYVTHVKRLRDLPPSLALFYETIAPLVRSPKFGPVLWQLPPTFKRDDDRLRERARRSSPPGAIASSSASRAGSRPRSTRCCGSTASRS